MQQNENINTKPNATKLDSDAIYGQTLRTILIDNEGKEKQMNEIWVKEEIYEFKKKSDPKASGPFEPDIESILRQDANLQGELTEVLAFNIETYCQPGNAAKGVSRVVLVNEFGQRVLDTQIKVVNAAPTVKQRKQVQLLREQAQEIAPDIEDVRQMVLQLIKGRKVVGYLLNQKFKELQIHDSFTPTLANGQDRLLDCCYMFKLENLPQAPMEKICAQFLDLKFGKKRNSPHAFSEAKITMALFKKWKELYNDGSIKPSAASALKANHLTNVHSLPTTSPLQQIELQNSMNSSPTIDKVNSHCISTKGGYAINKVKDVGVEDLVEMTGAELLKFIENHVETRMKQKLNQIISGL